MNKSIANWWHGLLKQIKKHWMIYLMLLPFMLHLFFFSYRPMGFLSMAWMRFSAFAGMDSPWIGWENFESLLFGRTAEMFFRALRNTLILSAYDLVFIFPIPIVIAMFHELKLTWFRSVSQSVLLLPNFFSTVIVTGIAIAFLQPETGVINQMLMKLGIIDSSIYFMIEARYSRFIYLFVVTWMGAGMSSLIFLGSMMSIDKELYESASLDGASRLKRIWHITIPGAMPLITVMFILRVGSILASNTEAVLLLMRPLTQETLDVLGSYVWRIGLMPEKFIVPNLSLSAAAGLLINVVGMIMVVLANFTSKRFGGNNLF